MNIRDLTPKHINLDAARKTAPTYQGTFEELKSLYNDKKVTLVTNNNGDVISIWVDSGTNDVMIDELAGQNFSRVYWCKPVMRWVEMIIKGEEPAAVDYREDSGTLPHRVERVDLSDDSLSTVRNYLKKKYGYCLARGSQPTVERFDGKYNISDIEWGRKLSEAELACL